MQNYPKGDSADPSSHKHARNHQIQSLGAGFPRPKQKWDAACRWCKGAGVVMGLRKWEPCACREVPSDTPPIEESAPAIMHGLIEQQFHWLRVWRVIRTNRQVRDKVRIMVAGIFCNSAASVQAGWLARCLAWGESAPAWSIGPSRDCVLHAHAILGL